MLRRAYVPAPKLRDREPGSIARIERAVSYSGTTTPAPKTEPKRNRALLDMAQGRPCLLRATHEPQLRDDSVACHSNLSIHGKAGARKADDQYSVWGCPACHEWLDRGPAPATEKERVFMEAHLRQVIEWRYMTTAMHEPQRFRKAAQWALDELNATPVGGIE